MEKLTEKCEHSSYAPRRSQTLPDALRRSRALSDAPRRSQTLSDGPRRSHTLPHALGRSQTLPDALRRSQTLSDAPRRSQTLPDALRRSQTLPDALRRSHTLSVAPRRARRIHRHAVMLSSTVGHSFTCSGFRRRMVHMHSSAKGFPHSDIHSLAYSIPQFRLFLLKHLIASTNMVRLLHVPTYAAPNAGASEASGVCVRVNMHIHI